VQPVILSLAYAVGACMTSSGIFQYKPSLGHNIRIFVNGSVADNTTLFEVISLGCILGADMTVLVTGNGMAQKRTYDFC